MNECYVMSIYIYSYAALKTIQLVHDKNDVARVVKWDISRFEQHGNSCLKPKMGDENNPIY